MPPIIEHSLHFSHHTGAQQVTTSSRRGAREEEAMVGEGVTPSYS